MGPPVGSLFLILGGWSLFYLCASLLSIAAWLIAYRYLPERGDYAPEGPPERGSLRVILGDRTFLLFLGASTIAWVVYVAYETVLPISLVETHGIPEWGWGLLVVVNPLLVTLFQVRLTRRVLPYGVVPKWIVSMLLMGLPFLLLGLSSAIPLILVVLVLFVVGEMLWVPTSQSMVAHIAPADLRGAYMGIFGGAAATGFALAPFLGLQVRSEAGDAGMWAAFAAAAIVAALLGAVACSRAARRPAQV
jgi:predicted MFS family arabinose efflux permease